VMDQNVSRRFRVLNRSAATSLFEDTSASEDGQASVRYQKEHRPGRKTGAV
jgi:hypothetical protein